MPTADATKLEMVNQMLRGAGRVPISDLLANTPDALNALNTLDMVDREVQNRGWHWNTETNVELQVDGNDNIPIAADVFSIDLTPAGTPATNRPLSHRSVIKRGLFAYDQVGRTLEFTGPIVVDMIVRLELTDVPEVARAYIAARASRMFYNDARGRLSDSLREAEGRAHIELFGDESDVTDASMFHNPDVAHATQGRARLPRS